VVVGRLDAVVCGDVQRRGPAAEEVPRELPVVFGSRALPGRPLEQCQELVWSGAIWAWAVAVCVLLVAVPGREEVVCDHEPGGSEVSCSDMPSLWAVKSRSRWAQPELSSGRVEVVVAGPAVGADDPGEPFAEQRPGLGAVRPGAIRNSAVRLVSAPQSVRRPPAVSSRSRRC